MANIAKFKALRPVRDKVHLVATRPYYSYKKNVLNAKLEDNPYTFLRIINPEFGNPIKTKPNSNKRFEMVKDRYRDFINKGILINEESERLYLYRQSSNTNTCIGVIAGASVAEYLQKKIKIHEATLSTREAIFTRYLDIVGYNAEPVLLSYKGTENTETKLRELIKERPEYEFTTTDLVKHELWVLSIEQSDDLQTCFKGINDVYIADGHHRSASSAALFTNKGSLLPKAKYFLAYFVEESQLNIMAFNRLIRSLNNLTPIAFIDHLKKLGTVKKIMKGVAPEKNHVLNFYIENGWYSLEINPELIDTKHPVKSLDSNLLTELILKPILGIEDLKTSVDVDFLPGTFNAMSFELELKKKKYKLGFMLYPSSIEQIKAVADEGLYMPPKSTWVEPKLRSGLTIYNIHE